MLADKDCNPCFCLTATKAVDTGSLTFEVARVQGAAQPVPAEPAPALAPATHHLVPSAGSIGPRCSGRARKRSAKAVEAEDDEDDSVASPAPKRARLGNPTVSGGQQVLTFRAATRRHRRKSTPQRAFFE
jgi:hypothetical protein